MKYLLEQEIEPSLPLSQLSALTSGWQRMFIFLFLLRIKQIRTSSAEEFVGKRKLHWAQCWEISLGMWETVHISHLNQTEVNLETELFMSPINMMVLFFFHHLCLLFPAKHLFGLCFIPLQENEKFAMSDSFLLKHSLTANSYFNRQHTVIQQIVLGVYRFSRWKVNR